jgi:hypothetical protein
MILGELLKHGGDALARTLYSVIAWIWEELPVEWRRGALCSLYKKKSNYAVPTIGVFVFSTPPTRFSPCWSTTV